MIVCLMLCRENGRHNTYEGDGTMLNQLRLDHANMARMLHVLQLAGMANAMTPGDIEAARSLGKGM